MRHETAICGQNNLNPEIQVIIFVAFVLLFQQQKHKHLLNPYFIAFLQT